MTEYTLKHTCQICGSVIYVKPTAYYVQCGECDQIYELIRKYENGITYGFRSAIPNPPPPPGQAVPSSDSSGCWPALFKYVFTMILSVVLWEYFAPLELQYRLLYQLGKLTGP